MTRLVRFFAAVMVVAYLLAPSAAAVGAVGDRVRYTASEPGGRLAIDASRHHNHGKLLGGVTRRDGAYKFHRLSGDNRYDRIRTPSARSLNPRWSPFTYGARVKVSPNAEWSHSEMAVLRHGDTDTRGGDYKLELKKTDGGAVVAFCAMHDGDGDGVGYVRGKGSLKTIADGRWHTITCARLDRNTVSLTIDRNVTRRPTSGNLGGLASKDPLLIGFHFRRDGVSGREQFVGLMDGIHVTVR